MITFKQSNIDSYKRHQELFQILDMSSMTLENLKFDIEILSAGLIYEMICQAFKASEYLLIRWDGAKLKDLNSFNADQIVDDLLEYFFSNSLGIKDMREIREVANYFHRFCETLVMDHPLKRHSYKLYNSKTIQKSYNDYLLIQTYNPFSLRLIEKMLI